MPGGERQIVDGIEVVEALHARSTFALLLAKSALDEAGIPYLVKETDSALPPGFHGTAGIGEVPMANISACVFVLPRDEQAAGDLIAHLA